MYTIQMRCDIHLTWLWLHVFVSPTLSLAVCFYSSSVFFSLFLPFLVFYDFTSHFLLFAMFNVGFFYFFFRVHFLCACFCCFFLFLFVNWGKRSISVDVCSVTIERTEIQLNAMFFFLLLDISFPIGICTNVVAVCFLLSSRLLMYVVLFRISRTVHCWAHLTQCKKQPKETILHNYCANTNCFVSIFI